MQTEEPGHHEKGLSKILSQAWAYDLFSNLIMKKHNRIRLVERYIRPLPGYRILEIGCGTANILSQLPDTVGEYVGFDMNPLYIEFAKRQWGQRANCRFFCQSVADAAVLEKEHYDAVLALGILHHLNDNEATRLFNMAHHALKPNGALITYDNVYVENQNRLAHWLISRDRGRAVRTDEGYTRLARQYFEDIEGDILHDMLRIPYTIFIMRCVKQALESE